MNTHKTLIILDWDDTLFPTTWLNEKGIDLNNKEIQHNNIIFFSKLDILLYKLLSNLLTCGTVIIVTNATLGWINTTLKILPYTRKLMKTKIDVISAKDLYQNKVPDMDLWKKQVFKNQCNRYFKNRPAQTIISIGDSDFEFNASIDLYKRKSSRVLKTVKFMQSPSYDTLIDQLEVLNSSVPKICGATHHMDLRFNMKGPSSEGKLCSF